MSEQQEYDKQLEERNIEISNRFTLERNIRVAEEARRVLNENKGKFEIRLRIPTGNKYTNILGQEEIEFKEREYETKAYTFRQIATNDWNLLLKTRAELNNEMVKPVGQADNIKINDLTTRLYEFLALKFLGMKHDDYIRAEWDDVKLAVDVCSFITESGVKKFEADRFENQTISAPNGTLISHPVESIMMDEETLRLNSRTKPSRDVELPSPIRTFNEEKKKKEDNNSSSKKYYRYDD